MNSPEVKDYIQRHSSLFWYIKEERKEDIDPAFLVETILNYGSLDDVKELFRLLGQDNVADIFYKSVNNKVRINYFPLVLNFFNMYFQKYAQRDIK